MDNIKQIIKSKNKEVSSKLGYKTLSVTGCTSHLTKGFDKEAVSKKCFEKGFNDPESKYYQMTQEAILESWSAKSKESCHYGSLVDDYIGMTLNEQFDKLEEWKLDNSFDYNERLQNLCKGFDQFHKVLYENTDYRYVTREEQMYIKSNKTGEYINGRFDCLFYSPSLDKYMVVDWKTSESIDKENKWEKMLGPLYDYDACNLNEYTVQVQMYKKALCETYGISTPDKVDTYICQFSKEVNPNGNYYMLHKPGFDYSSERLDNVIEFAYKKVKLKNK